MQWHMPIILATGEDEAGESQGLSQNNKKFWRCSSVVHVAGFNQQYHKKYFQRAKFRELRSM